MRKFKILFVFVFLFSVTVHHKRRLITETGYSDSIPVIDRMSQTAPASIPPQGAVDPYASSDDEGQP